MSTNLGLTHYKYFLFSETPDELVKFYTDCLGFEIVSKLELPKDYGYALTYGDKCQIWLAFHSDVKGVNQDSFRHILNIYTDEVTAVYEKVKNWPGVKIVQEPIAMSQFNPAESRYVLTILDPEGNALQFMGQMGLG